MLFLPIHSYAINTKNRTEATYTPKQMKNFGGQKISRISVKYMTEIKLERQKSGEKTPV
jgi:hypothetical protein